MTASYPRMTFNIYIHEMSFYAMYLWADRCVNSGKLALVLFTPMTRSSVKLFLLANTDLVCFTVILCSPSNAVIWIILVFMSPETLQVREWRSVLSGERFKKQVVLVAVDEAHCISEWLEYVACP